MIIKKATIKDVPSIIKLWKEFRKNHNKIVIKKNPKFKPYLIKRSNAAENFKKFVQKNIRSKNSVVYIAEVNGKLVGYSLIYIKDNIPIFKLEKIGYISDLFVKKEFRNQGISSKFKEEAITWFKKKGIKHISLAVYKNNKFAHSIYKKWGFFDYYIEMRRKV